MPPPRHSHLIHFWRDALYLFGGQDELGAHSAAMWVGVGPDGEDKEG
jgi:hypothetical protein